MDRFCFVYMSKMKELSALLFVTDSPQSLRNLKYKMLNNKDIESRVKIHTSVGTTFFLYGFV